MWQLGSLKWCNITTELHKICSNDVTYIEEEKDLILWVSAIAHTIAG
jgi:hypothetical protein